MLSKRYESRAYGTQYEHMEPNPNGDYYRVDEADAALAQLRGELDKSKRECGEWFQSQMNANTARREAEADRDRLRAALGTVTAAKLRNAARCLQAGMTPALVADELLLYAAALAHPTEGQT